MRGEVWQTIIHGVTKSQKWQNKEERAKWCNEWLVESQSSGQSLSMNFWSGCAESRTLECKRTSYLSSVQSLSRVWLFVIPWTAARQASLSIANSWSFLRLMFIESVMSSNHFILCRPLLLLPSIFSSIRVFSNESVLRIKVLEYLVAKVLEFQLQHQSFQWIFRTDFLQNGLVGSPCSPRDSQESSPTPHFKSINYSVLSLLHRSNSHSHTWLLEKP